MYKYILESSGNINWMAIFALITFFALFVISVVVVFRRSPAFMEKMANLPLEDNKTITTEITEEYEK